MDIKFVFITCVMGASLSGCEFGKGVVDITRNVGCAWATAQTQIISNFISDYLIRNAHLKPELNVHDLDDIVPLPPAPLPEWYGKISI